MQLLLHPSDQPVFRLRVRSAQCGIEVRLNDVPLARELAGGALALDLPVNEWLFQGGNALHVTVYPAEEGTAHHPETVVSISLIHRFARDAAERFTEAGQISWKPEPKPVAPIHEHEHPAEGAGALVIDEFDPEEVPLLALPGQAEELVWRTGPPVKLPTGAVRLGATVQLPPPWPCCPWLRSEPLTDQGSLAVVAGRLLKTLHDQLRMKDLDAPLRLRRKALEAAYYLSPADADEALGIVKLLRTKGWELQPLPGTGLRLELAGGSRLARLIDDRTGESPLLLVNEQLGICAVFDAWWMLENEWKLIR